MKDSSWKVYLSQLFLRAVVSILMVVFPCSCRPSCCCRPSFCLSAILFLSPHRWLATSPPGIVVGIWCIQYIYIYMCALLLDTPYILYGQMCSQVTFCSFVRPKKKKNDWDEKFCWLWGNPNISLKVPQIQKSVHPFIKVEMLKKPFFFFFTLSCAS